MKMVKLLSLFYCFSLLTSCNEEENKLDSTIKLPTPVNNCVITNTLPDESTTNLLFIGNSLTYTNNLPEMVTQIAREKGYEVSATMIAHPNYAIEDHWWDGCVQLLIASGKFDFVILQQGPSSQEDGRVMLMEYGAKFKELCNSHNAKLAFFMVWPAKANLHMFSGVIRNYSDAATKTESFLCPVGQIWKDHFDATADFSYYGADQFHPSQSGSKIAAKSIFQTLFEN